MLVIRKNPTNAWTPNDFSKMRKLSISHTRDWLLKIAKIGRETFFLNNRSVPIQDASITNILKYDGSLIDGNHCVYYLVSKGYVQYVGETKYFHERYGQHCYRCRNENWITWDSVYISFVSPCHAKTIEKLMIKFFKPKGNKKDKPKFRTYDNFIDYANSLFFYLKA